MCWQNRVKVTLLNNIFPKLEDVRMQGRIKDGLVPSATLSSQGGKFFRGQFEDLAAGLL